MNVNEIFDATDKKLTDLDKTHLKYLNNSIKRLENKILKLYQEEYPKGKQIFKVAQAQRIHKQILKLMETEYGVSIKAITDDYAQIDSLISKEFAKLNLPFEYTTVDENLLKNMRGVANSNFRNLGSEASGRLSQSLYNGVAAGTPFGVLVDEMKNILTGITTMRGTPLASYAGMYAQDSLMNYYASMNNKKAKDAGLKYYLYYGNIMATTRPFCFARAGLIFSEEEIESWNRLSWKGQSCDVWVCRGGFRCRHHLRAVMPEWIEDGQLDVQSYYDERPEKITTSLKAEVEAERAKITPYTVQRNN